MNSYNGTSANGRGQRVVVAMSGGVDSSVAAALLVEQGYDVIGVMLRLWAETGLALQAEEPAAANKCCSAEAVYDARAVADKLGIPFYVLSAEKAFKRTVVDFFIEEHGASRTPNPCLACNREIRFGYLLEHARALGARYLATGHYAQLRHAPDGSFQLWRGADPGKDQSYVLHVLGQAELAQVMFPVGGYTKPQVRMLAGERGLPTASRTESQDLCFVADGNYRRFLGEWAPGTLQPGPILDQSGRQLGTHGGLPGYTIGQRSGLRIAAARPLYVLTKDPTRNALVVGPAEALDRQRLRARQVHWLAGAPERGVVEAAVQIRYRSKPAPAVVRLGPNETAEIEFREPVRGIAPGQAAVFYDGEQCLGGGLIMECEEGDV